MRNKGWETLVHEWLHKGGMEGGRFAGQIWEDVCHKWWTSFGAMCMCLFAWQTRWFAGGDLKRLREYSIAMDEAHLQLHWGKLLWSHLWIDHIYFFARQWRILSKFACVAMEGSSCCAIVGA